MDCDVVDGPVASAAMKALDVKNVNLVLPYVAAEAEGEVMAAFEQAIIVRGKGAEAKTLADRYFMETAVRLHRTSERAPYTGLKPAGTDFGPAIPAAEKTLETGKLDSVISLISEEVAHGLAERFGRVADSGSAQGTIDTRRGGGRTRARERRTRVHRVRRDALPGHAGRRSRGVATDGGPRGIATIRPRPSVIV
jgi:hypothetical protein